MKKKFIENAQEIIEELRQNGNDSTIAIYKKHGDLGQSFGNKFAFMKILRKKITPEIEKRKVIANQLWDSKILEPMILATWIFNPKDFSTKKAVEHLNASLDWKTIFYYFSNYVCPFIEGIDKEIDNIYKENKYMIRILGYTILSVWATLYEDDKLPMEKYISWTKQLAIDIKNEKYDYFELSKLYSFLTSIFVYVNNPTINKLVRQIIKDFPPNDIKKLAPKDLKNCVVSDPFKIEARLIKLNKLYVKRKTIFCY